MPIPLERQLTVRPIAGMWTLDPADKVPEGASPDMFNFQLYNGYLRKRPGYSKYQAGSAFPAGPITGIYSAQQVAGTRALYVTNQVGLFKYNIGTTAYDAQSGPALTGGPLDLFSFEISQNNLVFSQGVDNIMALPLTGSTYAVISTDAKPTHYLTRWNQRLYAAFTVEGGNNAPFRVRWPVNGDHTNWIGVGSGFVDLTDDIYQIRNAKKLVDVYVVYTEKGIFLATKTGNATGPAQFALQVKEIGLFSRFTLQGINVIHFLLGTDNFYTFNGVQLTPIGQGIRNTVFKQMNPASANNNFSTLFYDSQEYVAFIATDDNTSPDTAWVYNWVRNVMYPWVFTASVFTCATLHFIDSSVTIASLTGTIAAQTWVIGAFTLTANSPLVMLGDANGHVNLMAPGILSDDGTAIPCRWTSKDYTAEDIDPSFAGQMVTLREVGFSYVDPGSTFTLQFSYSTDRGISWKGPFAVTVGGGAVGSIGDGMSTYQATGKRVRFKIENNTTNEMPQVQEFYPRLELRRQKIA